MTEKRANEIFRSKYPNGAIYNGKNFGGARAGQMVVVFEENGKCYTYSAGTYQQVLSKLGFNVLYREDVLNIEMEIEKLEKHLKDGGRKGLFCKGGFVAFTEAEIAEKKSKIEEYKHMLEIAIIE